MTKYSYYVDLLREKSYHSMYEVLVKYDKYIVGSGYNLMTGVYDVHFECTAKQWKPIAAALRRRGKIKVTRYTQE